MPNKYKKTASIFLLIVISCLLFVYQAAPVFAQEPLVKCDYMRDKDGKIVTDANKKPIENDCTLSDFSKILVKYAGFFLGLSGSIALLFFVYGGFVWLISGGNKEKVQQGKNILISATVGIIIIFTAFTVVNLTISTLTGQKEGKIFGQEWWKLP